MCVCHGSGNHPDAETTTNMTGGRFAQADIERKSNMTEKDIQREAEFVSKLKIQ